MLWCQGAQNNGLSNHKLKSRANVHRTITMHAHHRQTNRKTNIIAIAERFTLTNAPCARSTSLPRYQQMYWYVTG